MRVRPEVTQMLMECSSIVSCVAGLHATRGRCSTRQMLLPSLSQDWPVLGFTPSHGGVSVGHGVAAKMACRCCWCTEAVKAMPGQFLGSLQLAEAARRANHISRMGGKPLVWS